MQHHQLGDNQALNLHIPPSLALLLSFLLLPLCESDLPLLPGQRLAPLRPGHADPPLVRRLGRDEDNLPLARREQVADDQVVCVALQGRARLVHEQVGVRLELERHDHAALGGPAVDQPVQELGDRVEVDDEFFRLAGRLFVVVAGVHVVEGVVRRLLCRGQARRDLRRLDLVLGHAIARNEKVAHGRGQVEQRIGAQRLHQVRQCAELEDVLRHGGEGEDQQQVVVLCVAVLAEHVAHGRLVLVAHHDRRGGGVLVHKVEEAVGRVAVVARIRQQRELAVQEDDGVSVFEELLGRRRAARACREVVDEADGLGFELHRQYISLRWVDMLERGGTGTVVPPLVTSTTRRFCSSCRSIKARARDSWRWRALGGG
jgi:hypothetical protein